MIPDEERCPSLYKTFLHRVDTPDLEVYLRCQSNAEHTGRWHRHRVCKWTDDQESGWLENEECDDERFDVAN